ncbi:MAG: hypothetical protein HGA31_06130 [Candidatus Moranbacteria bacterium]|nr:hypothetical protein [Candidatus Moranbacteria bacterium]
METNIADFPHIKNRFDAAIETYDTLTESEIKGIEEKAWEETAGIRYLNNREKDRLIENEGAKRKRNLEHFRFERDRFWTALVAAGAEPLVILSTNTFERLRTRLGLYLFHMRRDGKVNLNEKTLENIGNLVENSMLGLNTVAIIGVGSLIGNFAFTAFHLSLGLSIFLSIMSIVIGFAGYIGIGPSTSDLYQFAKLQWTRLVCSFLGFCSRETLLRLFMTDRSTLPLNGRYDTDGSISVRPIFPEANEEVGTKLKNLLSVGFRISIAAAPDAFEFVGGDRAIAKAVCNRADRMTDEMIREWKRKAAERKRKLSDPIVFVEKDGLVAIVAQYGEFKPEKAMIEEILNVPDII